VGDQRAKLLVVGLELGDGPLLLRWAEEGRLPVLRGLVGRGRSGPLATTALELHVSPLPSLYTGVGPGEHGVYFTFQPAPGVQGWQRFHTGLYGRPTFWRLLDEAGRRCVVLDAPYTHPEQGYGGSLVIDWGAWARYLGPTSMPEPLARELERAVGKHPMGMEAHDIGLIAVDAADMRERAVRSIAARSAASRWLMDRAPADLVFTVFDELHPAGHYCWRPGSHEQPELLAVAEAFDRALGELVEHAGPETTVVVVSGDAIGPNHAGWHLLPEVLTRLGLFASADAPPPAGADGDQPRAKARFDAVKAVRDLLPKDFRKRLARMMPTGLRDSLAKRVDTASIDWSRTKAFCLITDLEGCIRVNLKGREPLGIVEPGAEYDRLVGELVAALMELVNPATGAPAVTRVIRADDAFKGQRRDWLPDLVVHWAREAPIAALASPRIGTISGLSPDRRPGTHAGPGFAVVAGPGIGAGSLGNAAHIFDLAPTVLARLGVSPPGHMSGRPWPIPTGA
jgi:predicted AlkP superfamily phosphohydrolase/phosphomutase